MKSILHLVIITIYLTLTNSNLDYIDLRRNLISHIQRYQSRKYFGKDGNYFDKDISSKYGPWVQEKEILRTRPANKENDNSNVDDNDTEDRIDVMRARQKALVLSKAKGKEAELNDLNVLGSEDFNNRKIRYHMDPVFNVLRSTNLRRDIEPLSTDTESSSSSMETGDFKEQFKELWLQKKYEALNATIPQGDQVNMVAARK